MFIVAFGRREESDLKQQYARVDYVIGHMQIQLRIKNTPKFKKNLHDYHTSTPTDSNVISATLRTL